MPSTGLLITNKDDKNCLKLKAKNIKYFSLADKTAVKIKKILKVPGLHNVANALAVYQLSHNLGIKEKIIFKALSKFQGSWRRFDIIKTRPYVLISDYAHHPTEIKALLQAAKEKYPDKKIICVFQPHQFQRTKLLFKEFSHAFGLADKIILSDIYEVAGRENKKIFI